MTDIGYTTTEELQRVLKIRTPTTEQQAALERVLNEAALEIDREIDRAADAAAFTDQELDLLAAVNLDRGADLWRHTESIPGMTGLLGEGDGSAIPGRYSWERYAQRLAVVKGQWGIA